MTLELDLFDRPSIARPRHKQGAIAMAVRVPAADYADADIDGSGEGLSVGDFGTGTIVALASIVLFKLFLLALLLVSI